MLLNATGDDTEGMEMFSIDETTGIIRTRVTLDHEQKAFYRMAVSAKDQGRPAKETVRQLQIEVLDLNDNRPTFSTSSLTFKVRESRQSIPSFLCPPHPPLPLFHISI